MNKHISKVLFLTLSMTCFAANAIIDENVNKASTQKVHTDINVKAETNVDFMNKNQQQVDVININQATAEKLVTLKGIGIKKALAIVEYRKANGEFTHLNELLKVKGIGEQVIKDNKVRISI